MRVSRQQAALNRERILAEAGRLFRERGLSGVGVDALAAAAGLTHGGLYGQFDSKEELAAQALAQAFTVSAGKLGDVQSLQDYADVYLSATHRDAPGDGCAIAALASEAPRQSGPVRRSFTDGVKAMIGRLAALLPEDDDRRREARALAATATLVGALVLARAVDDPVLSDRLLAAAHHAVMEADPA
jgi:TetR/AcrR family transcriptional regulator, transcriptional repressor for nem operon